MPCVDYNLIKEGIVLNNESQSSYRLTDEQLRLLYDGGDVTPITISGTGDVVSLDVNFGETYDVCFIRYNTDESLLSNIEGYTATFSGIEVQDLTWYLESSGVYRADLNYPVKSINITHTISSGISTDISLLKVYCEENSTLGFGSSTVNDKDKVLLKHATDSIKSATPNVITLFNDNSIDQDVAVAIAPSFSEEDNYLFLSTTESGIYYGIDEYGVGVPGHKKSSLVNDPMLSTTVSGQWYVRYPSYFHKVFPTQEGLSIEVGDNRFKGFRFTVNTIGLLSSDSFSPQSFTAEVKFKFDSYINFTDTGTSDLGRAFLFGITNSVGIPDIGYRFSKTTINRPGDAALFLALSDTTTNGGKSFDKEDFTYKIAALDGASLNYKVGDIEVSMQTAVGRGGSGSTYGKKVQSHSLDEMEDFYYESDDLRYFTSSAKWHTWKIVFNHIENSLEGYVDNIYIGKYSLKRTNFFDGTRMFIGSFGDGNFTYSLKDFKITYDEMYTQYDISTSSSITDTVSGTYPDKIKEVGSVYVAPSPNTSTTVKIDFPEPIDLTSYSIKQPVKGTANNITVSGSEYFCSFGSLAIVDFGGKLTEIHNYYDTGDYNLRAPTFSGTAATVVSGIDYISFNFVDYDEATISGALMIEDIKINYETSESAVHIPIEIDGLVPWSEGEFHNVKSYGTSNSISIRDRESIVMTEPTPEYAVEFIDYGFSAAVTASESFDNIINSYHKGSEIFFPTYHDDPGDQQEGGQHAWWTGPSSPNYWAWMYFKEESKVNSVFWDSFVFEQQVIADEFKFQYLQLGGNPNVESDWIDFPVITKGYHLDYSSSNADGAYKQYKEYLIANNDGEYYTDYYNLYDCASGIGFGIGTATGGGALTGILVPTDYMEYTESESKPSVRMIDNEPGNTNGKRGFIEFDEPVYTRGLRMVVRRSLDSSTGALEDNFGLDEIFIYRENSAGSYTSPIFDTGTPQNTERLKITYTEEEGSEIRAFVRSSPTRPKYSFNPMFEIWECIGTAGNSQIEITNPNTSNSIGSIDKMSAQVYGDYVYCFFDAPYKYEPARDAWSLIGGGYPAVSASDSLIEVEESEDVDTSISTAGYELDNSIRPGSVRLGNTVYIAARTLTDIPTYRFLIYHIDDDRFEASKSNMPDFARFSSMAPSTSGEYIYFLSSNDSNIYSYRVADEIWETLDASAPHVSETGCSVLFEGEVYVFGGNAGEMFGSFNLGSTVCWKFRESDQKVYPVTSCPYRIYEGNALLVEEERAVYILPHRNANSSSDAPMKYFFDDDRWEVIENFLSFGEIEDDPGANGPSQVYFKYGNHIYGLGNDRNKKSLVVRDEWSQGKMPDKKDPYWGYISSEVSPWTPVGTFGEFLPQDRYFQFKIEMYSHDLETTPVLNSIRVVQPQNTTIPASGTKDIYLKVGAIPEIKEQVWYCAYDSFNSVEGNSSMFYNFNSGTGLWSKSTTISGTWDSNPPFLNDLYNPVSSAFTINDSGIYKTWHTAQRDVLSNQYALNKSIWYAESSDEFSLGDPQEVVPLNNISQSEDGASFPCVVKSSPSSYEMWYTGEDSNGVLRIIYCTSSDGITWSGDTVSLDIGTNTSGFDSVAVSRPMVMKEDSIYKMWYTGEDAGGVSRILYVESSDGLSWGFSSAHIVPEDYKELSLGSVYGPSVAKYNGSYTMMFIFEENGARTAVKAKSDDGITWSSYTSSIPSGGIMEDEDSSGPTDVSLIISSSNTSPGSVFSSASLKIHNLESGL